MKIEKLTENKIRVIVNFKDLDNSNLDINFDVKNQGSLPNFFIKLLDKAEKEVGFNTDGCRLLIETFASHDDFLVFTITKYSQEDLLQPPTTLPKKKLSIKRKTININKKQSIYKFSNFEEFCNFCNCIKNMQDFNIKDFSKNISLYLFNNTYFLILNNINTSYKYLSKFYSCISEFAKPCSYSNNFCNKLFEHGKVIIKKDAINIGIKYF